MRRCTQLFLLNNMTEAASMRGKPGMAHPLFDVSISPYKDQFVDYWSTPVPFADREYGPKPKLGDPVPTRRAAATIVVARNKFADAASVSAGTDNDYKVLMMYREAKGHFVRDQFILPALPIHLEDSTEDWTPILHRHGVTTHWPDLHHRLAAHRALLTQANILVIPKEGGGIAEVEGPPGPRRWHLMVQGTPKAMKQLISVLELPMETTLSQFIPFRHILTPTCETFRYDNLSYLVPFDKIPEVDFTISTVGEQLVWVSPLEGLARFNAGIMNMPTPSIILLSELHNECPTFADVLKKTNRDVPRVVQPELFRHGQTKVATVLLPGDFHHRDTTPADREAKYVRRFLYEKDYPWGVRAVFDERPATPEEIAEPLVQDAPALLEEANEMDSVYEGIPYPTRKPQRREGRSATAYPVPAFQIQEGPENAEGLVGVRADYMKHVGEDMYKHTP